MSDIAIPMRRVLVIGLDGGTLDVLLPLVRDGQLPHLKRVMDNGAWGKLRTVVPPGTGPAWSSIITGLDPSNHGIADLIVRAENSYDLAFLNASSLRAPTVWDLVGQFGGEVVVLNVPMTYPARPVNGVMITGLDTPADATDCAYPRDLLQSARSTDPAYRINPEEPYVPGKEAGFVAELTSLARARGHVLTHLLEQVPWKFAMQVFSETDFLQHAVWHTMDRTHPRYRAGDEAKCRPGIIEFYRTLDRLIGQAADLLGNDGSLVILSDHGAGPLHEFIHANNALLAAGAMKVRRRPLSWIKYWAFRAGFTPLVAYRVGAARRLGKARMGLRWSSKGYNLLRRFFFSFSDIDWARTKAYAVSGGVYGGMFVNLRGREPSGIVPPDQYDKVRQELKQLLLGFRHPRTGKPFIKQVVMREELYGGRFLEELPDLYFLPSDPTQAVFGDFEFSSNRVVESASSAISAQHRMDGILIVKGAGIKPRADLAGMTVMDVLPLILYLMGLPIPEGLDGRFKPAIFEEQETAGRPPRYFRMEGGDYAGKHRRATDDESLKQRLKGLGYIS